MYASDVGVFYSKPPDIRDISLQLLNGGESGAVAFCALKDFCFQVNATDILGWEDIESIVLRIDPATPLNPNGADLAFEYTASSSSFSEISDPMGVAELHSTAANVSHDDDLLLSIDFNILFNWNFPHEDPLDCVVEVDGELCPFIQSAFDDFLVVEKDLAFTGILSLTDDVERTLGNGTWVKGGSSVHLDGLVVIYQGYPNIHPPDGEVQVNLSDGNLSWTDTPSPGESVHIMGSAPEVTQEGVAYSISVINSAMLPSWDVRSFNLNVDSTAPGAPPEPLIHADSPEDPRTDADNDLELFLEWNQSSDIGSGIFGYYYGTSNGSGTTGGTFTSNTSAKIDVMVSDTVSLFVWAVDAVGNIGQGASASIIYDTDGVDFSFEPATSDKEWHNSSSIQCTVMISDTGGSGVDPDSIAFSISTDGTESFQDWVELQEDSDGEGASSSEPSSDTVSNSSSTKIWTGSGGDVEVTHSVEFQQGEENYIQYRTMDRAGNGYYISPAYQLQIDTSPVTYADAFPNGSIRLRDTHQSCSITISDGLSGVDGGSVMYRFSTSSEEGLADWSRSGLTQDMGSSLGDDTKWQVDVVAERGDGNKIQWMASDKAGNSQIVSPVYTLWVNRVPVASFDSPSASEEVMVDDLVRLSAQNSTDPDNDTLTFNWSSDIQGHLGTGVEIWTSLEEGTHTIRLEVSDGFEEVEISKQVNVSSLDEPDEEGDSGDDSVSFMEGSNSWWFILLIFIIIMLLFLAIFFYLRSKHLREDAQRQAEVGELGGGVPRESSYSEIVYSPSISKGTRKMAVPRPGVQSGHEGGEGGMDGAAASVGSQQLPETADPAVTAPVLQLPPSSRGVPIDLHPSEKLKLLETRLLRGWITQDLYLELKEKFEKELEDRETQAPAGEADITGISTIETAPPETVGAFGESSQEKTFDTRSSDESALEKESGPPGRKDELDDIFQ